MRLFYELTNIHTYIHTYIHTHIYTQTHDSLIGSKSGVGFEFEKLNLNHIQVYWVSIGYE